MGWIVGTIPFFIFLWKTQSLSDYLFYLFSLKDISLFAKVPLPPSLKYFENDFILAVIVLSIISILKINKEKYDFKSYIKAALVLSLILLEQKNIIRSIYTQISFIGLILFIILFDDLRLNLRKIKLADKKIFFFLINFLTLIFLIIYIERNRVVIIPKNIVASFKSSACFNNKLLKIPREQIIPYEKVVEFVSKDKRARIFSFPGDSIFYILFNQIPPYYPSIYESTPIYAQNKQIKYIKENKINFVILNTRSTSIQDGVPDRVRAGKLYGFIKKNYSPYKKIEYFQIWKSN